MMPQNPLRTLRVLLFDVIFVTLFIPTSAALNSNVVSIQSEPYYQQQRDCAQGCLYTEHDTFGIDEYLGCSSPVLNDCYCRNDLASSASFYLTSCLTSNSCTAISDLPMAVSAYNVYCQAVSAEDGIAATSATTSALLGNNGISQTTTLAPNLSPTVASTDPVASFDTITSAPTSTPPTSNSNDSGGGSDTGSGGGDSDLGVGGIIGVVAGICTIIGLPIAIWMCCRGRS